MKEKHAGFACAFWFMASLLGVEVVFLAVSLLGGMTGVNLVIVIASNIIVFAVNAMLWGQGLRWYGLKSWY